MARADGVRELGGRSLKNPLDGRLEIGLSPDLARSEEEA
jgi:hypothetical protein